jgi:predicted dehydrogenase
MILNLGVIGTSWITESLLQVVQGNPNIRLKAVMSPRETSIQLFKDKYHFEKGYTDFNQLIEEGDINLLYIASPNSFHYHQTKMALQSKIHVLCEKPITLSLGELEELENVAIENGVYFLEAMRPVHHPHIKKIKAEIENLEPLQYAHLKMMQYSSKYDAYKRGESPRVFTKEFGGGALNDLGVYPLTLAILLFGQPNQIQVNQVLLNNGVDATTAVSLLYDHFICDCTFSKVCNTYTPNEMVGEKKTLLLSHVTQLDQLILVDGDKRTELLNQKIEDDMKFELDHFIQMIENQDQTMFQYYLKITKMVTKICDDIRVQSDA